MPSSTRDLTATASDSDGTVSKVEFFQGTTKLGEDLSSPYAFTWGNVAAGSYSLTAKATDNAGAITTSAAVSIIVNTPPTVSITSPTHPTTFTSPASFTINASAADADGTISKVEFYAGVALLGEDESAPYTLAMSNLSHGVYVLTAKATDNRGAVTTSTAVSAVVTDAPSVSITGPANNASLNEGANIIISASASDDGTVAKVEFFRSGTLLGEDTTAPFSFNWNNLPVGSWSLTARATDDLGVTTTSAAVNVTVVSSPNPRLDPLNQTGGEGENPLSRNYNWSVPLVALPGRAGLDLGLSLSYNSLVWTKNEANSAISFDLDGGFPSPGFRLGFPVIQSRYFNPQTGKFAFMLITPTGERVELRQVNTSSLYEAADSSHLSLAVVSDYALTVRSVEGSELSYEWKGVDFQCTKIKDRNGNFITINYTTFGKIDTVVDTLGRTIKFNYDGTNYLASITQTWTVAGSPVTHYWARFSYLDQPIQTIFSNLTVIGPQNNTNLHVVSQVKLDDESHYDFAYTSWGQVWKISNSVGDHLLNYRAYNLPGSPMAASSAQSDCPRFTIRSDWAENWNRSGAPGPAGLPVGAEQEVITTYSGPGSASWTLPNGTPESGVVAQVTQADGTYNLVYFAGTAGTAPGWRRGLASMIETYGKTNPDQANPIKQRSSVTTWTQDDENVSYQLNPRVKETNVYDFSGAGQVQNHARKRISYQTVTVGDGTSCSVPQDVYEYQADATTVLRHTQTDYYAPTSAYTSRRLIALIREKRMYEVDPNTAAETLLSQVGYQYDESGSIQGADAPVQHDNTNYGSGFVTGRGNVSSIKRYNVLNTSQFTVSTLQYNTAGGLVKGIDAAGHPTQAAYADQFAANGTTLDASRPATLAYPTLLTDADNYTTSVRYNYDYGSITWKQTPQPNTVNNLPGPEQTFSYDSVGRIQRTTNLVNGEYTRYVYPGLQANSQFRVDTYSSIVDGANEQNGNEAHTFKIFDGHGRIVAIASRHPGSSGGFSGQLMLYNNMGRMIKQSNQTETSASDTHLQWTATGVDAQAGWIYTLQTYDWKGRPLVTTNPSITGNPNDTTTKVASYSGCGCAGGDVVTTTDEGTVSSGSTKQRQQKVYRDVLGRVTKTETYNWDGPGPNGTGGSVYSATINTYNGRDQIIRARQLKGSGPSDPNDLTCLNNSLRFGTDNTWKQTQTFSSGWETAGFNDSSWSEAVDEGAYGTLPWGGGRLPSDTPAHYVWYYDSRNSSDYSTVYFRKSFVATSDSATLAVGADDAFTAYLNGVQVASGNNWQQIQWVDLPLNPGSTYVLAVVVTNTGGPGGLVADLASVGTTCEQSVMTYDGFGRLKTKHVPGQDANGVTTYNYNDDDTVASVFDARGTSQFMSYNNRRLVTGISYTAPSGSGISVPNGVIYGYDGAGNRTSMTDYLGGVTYQFDQLSRLTSETRNFSDPVSPGLTGSYTLSYTYNLAGEIKKITDPTNTTINYDYDQMGRLGAITGENSLYGGVSQYASGATYRAWGGLKGLTYGNNYSVAISYNARMQESEFELSGRPAQYGASTVMKTQFSYYADGKLKYAHDTLDERFDRAYSYDHRGALTEAYSGSEARDFINGTNSGAPSGPYRQSYQHDVFGNLTQRDNRFWSQTDSFSASYSNNRRQDPAFHYDAEGNLTQDRDMQYTYDAAGRNTTLFSISNSRTITTAFDGDGQGIKRSETQSGTTTVTYYLRSSLLGGKIITELDATGLKKKGYVFAGGHVFATQENGAVKWVHEIPLTAATATTGSEGWFNPESQPDPTGVNVGFEDPYINCCILPEPDNRIMPALLGSFGGSSKCTLDGMDIDCGWAMEMLENGSAVQCPDNDCGPRTMEHRDPVTGEFLGYVLSQPFQAWADGYSGFLPPGATYDGYGEWYILQGEKDEYGRQRRVRPENGDFGLEYNHPQNTGLLRVIEEADRRVAANYDDCREKVFGKAQDFASRSIIGREEASMALVAGGLGSDRTAMVAGLWGHESNFVQRPDGDAGPAQLTSWWRNNQPQLIVGDAYGTWHGRTNGVPFDGNVSDNLATLGNIVRFSRERYGNNRSIAYWYGPGDPNNKKNEVKNRNEYADHVMQLHDAYQRFFDCLAGN